MILSGSTTLRRDFLVQAPPNYLPPLNFSFDLETVGAGSALDFGVGRQDNASIFEYNLRSGIVGSSGRAIGTYQSGTNNFFFNVVSGSLVFKINDNLVVNDPFNIDTQPPFGQFYIKNYDSAPVDFSLNINGFSPPTEFVSLGTNNNLLTVEGYLRESGYYSHTGYHSLYQVFGVSVPPEYGAVNFFDPSGDGQIRYTISGGSYSFGDIIPVTFDTYFGEFTSNIEITGAGGTGTGITQSGISLNLYGIDNLMVGTNQLEFNLDYYSNVTNIVSIELEVDQSYRSVILSGNGSGGVTYEGYVNRSGTIFSANGNLTGRADLQDPSNAIYNTQYIPLDRYLDITKPGYFSKETPFLGINSFTYTGIPLTGTYDGPSSQHIGKTWIAKGAVTINYDFQSSDAGVINFNGNYPGSGLAELSPTFKLSTVGGAYLDYPNDPSVFPTGIGYGDILADATGKGVVTIFEPYAFFGSGLGRVATGSSLVAATGTGKFVYMGNIEDRVPYDLYPDTLPALSEPKGEFTVCTGIYKYGTTSYFGKVSTITGVFASEDTTWGVGSGPSELVFPGGGVNIQTYFYLPDYPGIGPSGEDTTKTIDGTYEGYLEYPSFSVAGPVFGDPRDTTLRPYDGGNGIYSSGGSVYGRSCIFSNGGEIYFTAESVGIYDEMVANPPLAIYSVDDPDFHAVISQEVNIQGDPGQPFYVPGVTAVKDRNPYVRFLNPIIYPETGNFTFTGYAKVPVDGNVDLFNLYEAPDEESTLLNYKQQGWVAGNKLKRPIPETFPADAASRYLKVEYTSANADSVGSATLRVQGGGETLEVLITGNSDGIR